MSEKTVYFTDFDVVRNRATFDADAEISLENFERLTGAYHFTQEVICQVRTPGGVCHQKHKRGCLGVMKDGREALIGNRCADHYFKSDLKFSLERKRVKDEIERQRIFSQYHTILAEQETEREALSLLHWQALQTSAMIKSWYKGFQPGVLRFIYNAGKTGNGNVVIETEHVTTEIRVIEGEEQEKRISKWLPEVLGRLSPLPEERVVQDMVDGAGKAKDALDTLIVCDPEALSFRKLKTLVTAIDSADLISQQQNDIKADVERFKQRTNLQLLFFVQDRWDDSDRVLAQILRMRGNKYTPADIRREEKRILATFASQIKERAWRAV